MTDRTPLFNQLFSSEGSHGFGLRLLPLLFAFIVLVPCVLCAFDAFVSDFALLALPFINGSGKIANLNKISSQLPNNGGDCVERISIVVHRAKESAPINSAPSYPEAIHDVSCSSAHNELAPVSSAPSKPETVHSVFSISDWCAEQAKYEDFLSYYRSIKRFKHYS